MRHEADKAVAVVAGRRIDAAGATRARFPAAAEANVRSALKPKLVERRVDGLVVSAACGADIIALEVAAELGIRCKILLPFDRQRFRQTSVFDHGETWGERYDRVIERADASGDLTVLGDASSNDAAAYALVTRRLISDGAALAIAHGRADCNRSLGRGAARWRRRTEGLHRARD